MRSSSFSLSKRKGTNKHLAFTDQTCSPSSMPPPPSGLAASAGVAPAHLAADLTALADPARRALGRLLPLRSLPRPARALGPGERADVALSTMERGQRGLPRVREGRTPGSLLRRKPCRKTHLWCRCTSGNHSALAGGASRRKAATHGEVSRRAARALALRGGALALSFDDAGAGAGLRSGVSFA